MKDTLSTTLDGARARAADWRDEEDREPCEHDHVTTHLDWGDGTEWCKCLGCGRKWEAGERESLRQQLEDEEE